MPQEVILFQPRSPKPTENRWSFCSALLYESFEACIIDQTSKGVSDVQARRICRGFIDAMSTNAEEATNGFAMNAGTYWEDQEYLYIPVTITSEGVHNGALKTKAELQKAFPHFENLPICILHPPGRGIQGTDEIHGWVRQTTFDATTGAIKGTAQFVKSEQTLRQMGHDDRSVKAHNALLDALRMGAKLDASQGYWHGTVTENGVYMGKRYDRREVNILPDHLAVIDRGASAWRDGTGFGQNTLQERGERLLGQNVLLTDRDIVSENAGCTCGAKYGQPHASTCAVTGDEVPGSAPGAAARLAKNGAATSTYDATYEGVGDSVPARERSKKPKVAHKDAQFSEELRQSVNGLANAYKVTPGFVESGIVPMLNPEDTSVIAKLSVNALAEANPEVKRLLARNAELERDVSATQTERATLQSTNRDLTATVTDLQGKVATFEKNEKAREERIAANKAKKAEFAKNALVKDLATATGLPETFFSHNALDVLQKQWDDLASQFTKNEAGDKGEDDPEVSPNEDDEEEEEYEDNVGGDPIGDPKLASATSSGTGFTDYGAPADQARRKPEGNPDGAKGGGVSGNRARSDRSLLATRIAQNRGVHKDIRAGLAANKAKAGGDAPTVNADDNLYGRIFSGNRQERARIVSPKEG